MVIADLGEYWLEKENKTVKYKEDIINAILSHGKQP
jgi:hypothetical protein